MCPTMSLTHQLTLLHNRVLSWSYRSRGGVRMTPGRALSYRVHGAVERVRDLEVVHQAYWLWHRDVAVREMTFELLERSAYYITEKHAIAMSAYLDILMDNIEQHVGQRSPYAVETVLPPCYFHLQWYERVFYRCLGLAPHV